VRRCSEEGREQAARVEDTVAEVHFYDDWTGKTSILRARRKNTQINRDDGDGDGDGNVSDDQDMPVQIKL
jgi:transcription elongation factor Elf1